MLTTAAQATSKSIANVTNATITLLKSLYVVAYTFSAYNQEIIMRDKHHREATLS